MSKKNIKQHAYKVKTKLYPEKLEALD